MFLQYRNISRKTGRFLLWASEEQEDVELTGEGLREATELTLGYTGSTNSSILADITYGIVEEKFGGDVTVNYEKFESGPDGITALESGSVDMYLGGIGTLPVATARLRGSMKMGWILRM